MNISETERLILYGIKHIIERDNWTEMIRRNLDLDVCNKIMEHLYPNWEKRK